jgi:hypothetical protein
MWLCFASSCWPVLTSPSSFFTFEYDFSQSQSTVNPVYSHTLKYSNAPLLCSISLLPSLVCLSFLKGKEDLLFRAGVSRFILLHTEVGTCCRLGVKCPSRPCAEGSVPCTEPLGDKAWWEVLGLCRVVNGFARHTLLPRWATLLRAQSSKASRPLEPKWIDYVRCPVPVMGS